MGNSALLLLMASGRGFDQNMMSRWMEKSTARRRWIFGRLADILFGIVCFFYNQDNVQISKNGTLVDPNDPSVNSDDRVKAILDVVVSNQKSLLLRELLRPLLVSAAELLAELMSPDPMLLSLMGGGGARPSITALPLAAPAPPAPLGPMGTPFAPPAPTGFAPNGAMNLRVPAQLLQNARANGGGVLDLGGGTTLEIY